MIVANFDLCAIGKNHVVLQEPAGMQLLLLFTTIRQLCEGVVGAIVATQGRPTVMPKITGMMELFSTAPAWVDVVKRSTCRLGVMRGLELAKSYHPDINPELLADGF